MTPLKIRLLGSPEVIFDRQPLSFPTQKALALLIFLVVEGGMHSRDWLMTLLWPERPADRANVSLRATLSRLRGSLRPAGDLLISEGGKVGFDFAGPIDLDLARLAAAAQREVEPAELSTILTLDRGEFLEGFSLPDAPEFDTWAAIQRAACRHRLETVYDRLSQHMLAGHNSAAAAETAARWVARAPLSEQAYRRLMAAQALSGHRSAALQTYQRLKEALQQELGLEPGRETVVLADNIGRGQVEGDRPGPSPTAIAGAAGPAGAAGLGLMLPLVGRSDEHGRLVAAFRRSAETRAEVVAVIGAAGVGKTRLVNAFQEWIRVDAPAAEVWQGRAFEAGGRLAYQPVVEALRPRLEQVNAPEDLLDDVWLAELSHLMPELRARYPDLPAPLTGDAHFVRARLFEAVALLGSALAERKPAVFALDDMQWADADTLDLIHYLARRWAEMGAPILLLMTIRQEAYAADSGLREWLTGLGRDATVTRLLLDSLSGEAVEQLVGRLAGEGGDELVMAATTSAFAAWLWAETRGLPFFIEALLQMLVEQGVLPVSGEDSRIYDFAAALNHVRSLAQAPLPPGVREVIQARLGQQSKAAGALLLAAAVMGRTCTFERLRQVANLSETEALEALEALLDGRLMSERPADRRPYTPAHDYIREVVYSESREARRRVFHRRALLGLEASGAPAAECAFHALAALLEEPAFRYSLAAGNEAFAAYAVQEALRHYEASREAARRMEAGGQVVDAGALSVLYRQRGQALELIQQSESAQANYEEMRELAVRRRDQSMELAAMISLSTFHGSYSGLFNPMLAKELALEALAKAQELEDRETEAKALWALTLSEFFSAGDTDLFVAYGRQGLVLARELGLHEMVGGTLNMLCWSFVGRKELEEARAALTEAQAIWRKLGNLLRLGEAYRFMMIVDIIAGDYRRMLAHAPELAELAARTGGRQDQLAAYLGLANGHGRQGRFGQALDFVEQSGSLAADIGYPNEEHSHMIARIGLYRAAGAHEEAERWADRLYAEHETIMPTLYHYYLTDAARAKIAAGKLDEGRAYLDDLRSTMPENLPGSHNITALAVAYGELRLAQGIVEDLFDGLEQKARPYREAGFNDLVAEEYWLRGRAAMAMGQCDAARAALLEARMAAEAQEERAVLWQILLSLADVEEACGNADTAGRFRDEARQVVGYIVEHAGELREVFLARPDVARLL